MNTPGELDGSEDLITSDEVQQRIWYIERWDCGEDEPDCLDDDCPRHGSTLEELTALRELHSVMKAGPLETLISEGYFPKQVQDEREDEGGIPEDLSDYIDWKSYVDDQLADYTPVTFRDSTYFAQ